ncbi:hypothetical protein M3Y99_01378800 [Aphelenchoides fujianensis]|nr:hypothetical protein M3Y99_01378800 [Aphelenchoides fujianensis]
MLPIGVQRARFSSSFLLPVGQSGRWKRAEQPPTNLFGLPDPFRALQLQNPFELKPPPTLPPAFTFAPLPTLPPLPDPLKMGDVLMDQSDVHKRLHRLSNSPNLSPSPLTDMFKAHDAGSKEGGKTPFLFHVAQDFLGAVVNFLFQYTV